MKMAQKFELVMTDDMDGSQAAETIEFGYDGNVWEIDLSALNAQRFRATMSKYAEAARKTRSRRGRPKGSANKAKRVKATPKAEPQDISQSA